MMESKKPKAAKTEGVTYQYKLSENLRYGNKAQKAALLKWISQPKYRKRRPTPQELIAECKRPNSGLYGLIEVRQKQAAELYWRQAAQDILRHINVVKVNVVTKEVIGKPVVAFVPVKYEQGGRIADDNYVPTSRVANDPAMLGTVIERAEREFLAWMDRWERFDEFLEVFAPVLDAYRKVKKTFPAGAGCAGIDKKVAASAP